jgi:GNAT superfamily N-acetyltransferase
MTTPVERRSDTGRAGACWRPALQDDLGTIVGLADAIHPAYPESPGMFASRMALHGSGAWLAMSGGMAAGYAIGHPWRGAPPPLDLRLDAIPDRPDRYWIHDLALLPSARGAGLGRAGVALLRTDAAAAGLRRLSLIAVGASSSFWRRAGFAPDPELAVPGCYGSGLGMAWIAAD